MIRTLRRSARSGFTLLELLIAMGLSGVVLAIAMKGFIDSNKMSNLAKSRLEVHNYGSNGARQAAQLLRQAQIIYYTGRPLSNVTPSTTAIKFGIRGAANTPPQLPLPTIFTDNNKAPVGKTPFVPGSQTTAVDYGNQQPVNIFRFSENLGALPNKMLEVAPAARDTSAAGSRNYLYNNCFPAPLAYFATAEFSTSVPDVGAADAGLNQSGSLPTFWSFYVFYLAPMYLPADDANIAIPGDKKDWIPTQQANPNFLNSRQRTRLPLALHMMRISNVPAAQSPNQGISGRWPYTDVQAAAATGALLKTCYVLEPPFDYKGTDPIYLPNYDPVPIKSEPGKTDRFATTNTFKFLQRNTTTVLTLPASGPRVNGGGYHTNYNNLGNDPPSQAALGVAGVTATDRILVPYIDPDSANGTSMRFVNNILPPAAAGANYRPYIPMMGPECDYLYNYRHETTIPVTVSNAGNIAGGAPELPKRALVSISTRYRTSRSVPFQFSTSTMEVELEGLANFASVRPKEL